MADSIGRGSRARRSWGSRGSSARSSAVFDDHLNPGPYYASSHSLRPAASRFSLNDQFAATRREYEFGYDDASIMERYSIADGDQEDTVVLGDIPVPTTSSGGFVKSGRHQGTVVDRSFYELLCLPQTASISPAQIRGAYYRLVQLLQAERQPPHLAPTAAALLNSVQVAFETLVEPYRKVDYDIALTDTSLDSDQIDVTDHVSELDNEGSRLPQLREEYLDLTHGEIRTSTDLGLRLELPTGPLSHRPGFVQRGWRGGAVPLDFGLRQSTTLGVPILGEAIQGLVDSAEQEILPKILPAPHKHHIRCAEPTLTVTGSAHGLLDEPFRLASSLLLSRYQPPGPSIHGRRRLEQLIASRFLPSLNVRLRQEFSWRGETDNSQGTKLAKRLPDTVIEQEVDLLSDPAITTRIAHSFDLPDDEGPLDVEICVQKGMAGADDVPSMGLAVHRRVGDGTAFVALDAGDWSLWPAQECREYSRFSQVTKKFANATAPFRNAPTAEVGYTVSSYDMGLRAGRAFTRPAERGVRGMDCNLDDDANGSWTASLGATTDTLAGYLRYGRDLFSSVSPSQALVLPPGNSRHKTSGIRAEVELGATQQRDFFLALRTLKRIGRFSKVGFEVGISPSNLHFSLYWSRLNQRISIPLLLATKSNISTELLFWSTIVPFLGFSAMEFLYWRPRSKAKRSRSIEGLSKDDLQEYISRRRAEADELTVVLASGVEPRQRAEREGGGLVILSAKYRVSCAPPDEIADVTVAVAALVDDGKLLIPKGLRKSHLLGFWDPAPLTTKLLFVRYLYKGKEHTVEVSGRDELRLP